MPKAPFLRESAEQVATLNSMMIKKHGDPCAYENTNAYGISEATAIYDAPLTCSRTLPTHRLLASAKSLFPVGRRLADFDVAAKIV